MARNRDKTRGALRAVWSARGWVTLFADAALILAAFLAAYFIRFHLTFPERWAAWLGFEFVAAPVFDAYLQSALLLAVLWVAFIRHDGGYESGLAGVASPFLRAKVLLFASFKAILALMALSYLFPALRLSRPVFALTWALALAMILLLRLIFRGIDRVLSARSLALQRVVVAGFSSHGLEFARRLSRSRTTVRVIGFVSTSGDSAAPDDINVLGTLEDIVRIRRETPFEKLVLCGAALGDADDPAASARLIEVVNHCEAAGVPLYALPNVLSVAVTTRELGTFSGMPLVRMRDASLQGGYVVLKETMDRLGAAFLLVAGLPVWLLTAVAVKLTSPGPVLFAQERVGLHGRRFRMYKFRSMTADAEDRLKELVDMDKLTVPGFKIRNDPRVTPFGRFLRRSSLDEIPQLLNVLKGQMSLVGPRPEMPALVERYNAWQRRRLKAKPGMTGYQQVVSRGVPLAAAIEHDLVYLKHQSLLLDLYIMARTVFVVLRGSGVTH